MSMLAPENDVLEDDPLEECPNCGDEHLRSDCFLLASPEGDDIGFYCSEECLFEEMGNRLYPEDADGGDDTHKDEHECVCPDCGKPFQLTCDQCHEKFANEPPMVSVVHTALNGEMEANVFCSSYCARDFMVRSVPKAG